MNPDDSSPKANPASSDESRRGTEPVESAPSQGHRPSRSDEGPPAAGPFGGPSNQHGREGTSRDEHHLRRGPPARISRLADVDLIESAILEGFSKAQPAKAHAAIGQLLVLARNLVLEAGKARFEKNFGTARCESCEGLKAGPGVLATCFQVRQCFFTNIKTSDTTPKQEKLIQILSKGSKDP